MEHPLNPGILKLDLLCKGARVDPSCDLEHDATRINRIRGGMSSGLEMILPEGLWVNVPVVEHFARCSPYLLRKKNGRYILERDGAYLTDVTLPPEPKFYTRLTSGGTPMHRVGMMQGTYIGIYPTRICQYWTCEPKLSCRFCSVGLNLGVTEASEKSVRDVVETVEAAREELGLTFVHFNTGYYGGTELDEIEPYIRAVKQETNLLIGVQCPPAPRLSRYDDLRAMGVDHVSFCFEINDPQIFAEVCPGKQKTLGQEVYFRTIEYCTRIFPRGLVAGEIVAGLEPPESSIAAIERLAKMGAFATVCVFRPLEGTPYADREPPALRDMVPIFRRMYEALLENNVPVPKVPNLKISIVLMPGEGKYLASVDEETLDSWEGGAVRA